MYPSFIALISVPSAREKNSSLKIFSIWNILWCHTFPSA